MAIDSEAFREASQALSRAQIAVQIAARDAGFGCHVFVALDLQSLEPGSDDVLVRSIHTYKPEDIPRLAGILAKFAERMINGEHARDRVDLSIHGPREAGEILNRRARRAMERRERNRRREN